MDFNWTVWDKNKRGLGMTIQYGIITLPDFNEAALIAKTDKGICYIGLPVNGDFTIAENTLKAKFPYASFEKVDTIEFDNHFDIYGTDFQIKVWKALLTITSGTTVTYKDIAMDIGTPKGTQAVGTAIGANPIALYIPCHRVIGSSGALHGYMWGLDWKDKLLKNEAA